MSLPSGTSPGYSRQIPPPPPARPDSSHAGMYNQDQSMMYGGAPTSAGMAAAAYCYPTAPTPGQDAMMNSYMNWAAMMGYYGGAAGAATTANYGGYPVGYGGSNYNGAGTTAAQYTNIYPGMSYETGYENTTAQATTPIAPPAAPIEASEIPLPEEPLAPPPQVPL